MGAPKIDILHGGLQPRGLRRVPAATYVGISATMFDAMVADGRMPKPKRINSCTVWDRLELDEHFSALPSDADRNPWDEPDDGTGAAA